MSTDLDAQYITLEQWRSLVGVVETGGYAKAALQLHKSQSAVTYSVQKIEALLSVKVFEIEGRKAVLTPVGQFLYRRAKSLLAESSAIERAAKCISAGWEPEIRIAAEILFPTWLLLDCFADFAVESPHTRIELIESVLSGTSEALLTGQVDLAIASNIPPGFSAEPLMQARLVPVASPSYPLHHLGRTAIMRDLDKARHIVVRDSGSRRDSKGLSIETPQRWTVSNAATSIAAVKKGYGFAWLAEEKIRDELAEGALKVIPLEHGNARYVQMYLIIADPDAAGPGTQRLAQLLLDSVGQACLRLGHQIDI